jgi:uncharacterized membrane protein YhaH (DUF805 family)
MSEKNESLWELLGRPLSLALFPLLAMLLIALLFGIPNPLSRDLMAGASDSPLLGLGIIAFCLIAPLLLSVAVGSALKKRWKDRRVSTEQRRNILVGWAIISLALLSMFAYSVRS